MTKHPVPRICIRRSQNGARANWVDVVWCLARDDADDEKTRAASGQAVDLVLVELVLCLIAQSASFMYR